MPESHRMISAGVVRKINEAIDDSEGKLLLVSRGHQVVSLFTMRHFDEHLSALDVVRVWP